MRDEEAEVLRSKVHVLSADQLIEMLVKRNGPITQFDFIKMFKAAFPTVPLRVLKEASASRHVVGEGGVDAARINELLDPWLRTG